MPLVEQELVNLPEHLNSPPVFSGVRVTRSLVVCVCFVDRCLSLFPSSFGHCVVCSSFGHCVVCSSSFGHCVFCSSSIYVFWLLLSYLQTLLAWLEVLWVFKMWESFMVLMILWKEFKQWYNNSTNINKMNNHLSP